MQRFGEGLRNLIAGSGPRGVDKFEFALATRSFQFQKRRSLLSQRGQQSRNALCNEPTHTINAYAAHLFTCTHTHTSIHSLSLTVPHCLTLSHSLPRAHNLSHTLSCTQTPRHTHTFTHTTHRHERWPEQCAHDERHASNGTASVKSVLHFLRSR